MKLLRLETVSGIDLGDILMEGINCGHGQEFHHPKTDTGVRRGERQGDNLGDNISTIGMEEGRRSVKHL